MVVKNLIKNSLNYVFIKISYWMYKLLENINKNFKILLYNFKFNKLYFYNC